MIVESAFSILPESIAGMGFQRVSREQNAVGALSFSLLNALHAKNVVDPIQRIQIEKSYATHKTPLPAGADNRHCDIYVDYGGSKIGSKRLENFGWRYLNYVEAKFLKSYAKTSTGQDTRSSANSAEIIADLVRLVALVPEPQLYLGLPNPKTSSARYFLVISDEPLEIFVNQYLKSLLQTFQNPARNCNIELDLSSGKPSKKLAERVGKDFNKLRLKLNHVTCFSHYPLVPDNKPSCWMILMRLDGAEIEYADGGVARRYGIAVDRTLSEANPGDYRVIREFVARNIK
jgi:hypothetical protein